ncbi:MAG TPA: hypothetical protein VJV03_17315 [Pyrinomonadaceae bacterium]|nr:hypothetical protein [Pyrinomonadaceae bacterium]
MKTLWLVFLTMALTGVAAIAFAGNSSATGPQTSNRSTWHPGFQLEVIVNGRRLEEYHARGRLYVEALKGAEYELRIYNPQPYRVAVALSVDGMNTIDARRTTAWNASKWVIEPYGSITVSGWQMSTQRARRFYFTSEQDSYGAKLGQTVNLGVISAVFFRETGSRPIPIVPGSKGRSSSDNQRQRSEAPSAGSGEALSRQPGTITQMPEEEYAATGIGRSVHNDVRWVQMDLDSRAAGQVTVRYEYYPALVRLGIAPRRHRPHDALSNREGATGFEDRRFSPEP